MYRFRFAIMEVAYILIAIDLRVGLGVVDPPTPSTHNGQTLTGDDSQLQRTWHVASKGVLYGSLEVIMFILP